MKLKLVFILLIQACIFSAQISNKLKKKVELIDKKFFDIMLQERYNTEAYSELYSLYSEISMVATNDELFYLSLNGNTFIRHNAASSLVYRKDKRIVDLYKYYSEFPFEYEIKLSCVISKQDMAISNIRANIFSQLKNYEDYRYISERLKNQPITDFYSKEQINYYEKLDTKFLNYCIIEFEKIDEIFIPDRLDIYKEINENWKDGKLQFPN